jgi:hypothetical protein
LFNKVLQISIDDLCFACYPCACQGQSYEETTILTESSVASAILHHNNHSSHHHHNHSSGSHLGLHHPSATIGSGSNSPGFLAATTHSSNNAGGGGGHVISTTTSSTGEAITMFNIIVTSVSAKAMRRMNADFAYKCQFRGICVPGADPLAASIGLRSHGYGICHQTIVRYARGLFLCFIFGFLYLCSDVFFASLLASFLADWLKLLQRPFSSRKRPVCT